MVCLWLTNQGRSQRRHVTELFLAFLNTWRATPYRLGLIPVLTFTVLTLCPLSSRKTLCTET